MMHRRNTAMPIRSRHFPLSAAIACCALLVGCVADPEFALGDARAQLLSELTQHNEVERLQQIERDRSAIKQVQLRGGPFVGNVQLSVELVDADLGVVIEEILSHPSIEYRASTLTFAGRVSARFEDRPLLDALNLLLIDSGVKARLVDQIIEFYYDQTISDAPSSDIASEDHRVSQEITLKHLQASDVEDMLSDLFSYDADDESQLLSVGSVAELNAVFVNGPAPTVKQAAQVIARADRPVPHVIISALVVKVNTSSVEALGASFSDLADGSFSISSVVPNTTGGNVVATFEELAGNTAQLTATIKFLAAQNIAQVLSRPYVATRSTKPATIEIVDDQFVRVDSTTDDASIIATDSITAGISMDITPIVMANSSVRLDLTIEDSRFSATAGDVLIAKERNTATTSMVVESGQTIVIGGLDSRYRISEKSGVPWLRKIPLINFFAAEQEALESGNEMVVYLTPYIWMPGMKLPRALEEQRSLDYPDLLSIEKFGGP